ncbi:MAG: DUF2127 domain-containing protein [Rhodanobacteraceae bacterium]|nr:MAG: DUF2127 domain-containing protein [Rhodanobacteraceae bacterium]
MKLMKLDAKALYHRAYEVGILLKGLDGVVEIIGGMALFLTTRPEIRRAVALLTRAELAEDPRDFVANLLTHMARNLSVGTRHFAAAYLLAHGLVKVGLVAGLLRGLRRSYPVALLLLAAFIGYQIHRLFLAPSAPLYVLTAVDIAIVLLIWREWWYVKSRRRKP